MDKNQAQDAYKQASALFQSNQFTESKSILESLLQQFPDEPKIQSALTRCNEQLINQQMNGMSVEDLLGTTTPSYQPKPQELPSRRSWLKYAIGAGTAAILALFGGYTALRGNDQDPGQAALDALSQPQITSTVSSSPLTSSQPTTYSNSSSDDPHPRIIFPDPVTYIDQPFNLEKEVARVMLDPRFPDVKNPNWEHYKKWNREFYQDIIDAAREKRLSHGNPYLGEKVNLPATDTITVPGNITGKDTFTIRYVSSKMPSSLDDTVWGDNEDIVYIQGGVGMNQLTIHPGTLVLFASFQNDSGRGAMTPEMISTLGNMYDDIMRKEPGRKGGDNSILKWLLFGENPDYSERLAHLSVIRNNNLIKAIGTIDRPIVFFSDAKIPTAYDYSIIGIAEGICDYIITEDHLGFDTANFIDNSNPNIGCTSQTWSNGKVITSRSVFNNHHAHGRNGSGSVIGCYFGEAGFNESLEAAYPEHEYHIMYNEFKNTYGGAILGLVFGKKISVQHNRFIGTEGIVIGLHPGIDRTPQDDFIVRYNDIFPTSTNRNVVTINDGSTGINKLIQNYWGTINPNTIRQLIWPAPNAGEISVNYSNPLSSPDSDLDGLRDDEERKLGTDPHKMDSDGDCLIDGLEVKEYKTDPKKWDHDKDGIPDGLEVYIGTNPTKKSSMTPIGSSGDFFYDKISLN